MKLKVYRSLDRSSSLFGIRGSFVRVAGAGALVAVILGMAFIGPMTNGLVGVISVVALLGLDYLGVMILQSRFSERALERWRSTLSLPRYIRVPPVRLSRCAGKADGGDNGTADRACMTGGGSVPPRSSGKDVSSCN